MTGRRLGSWRLLPGLQSAEEREWRVSVDLGIPDVGSVEVATIVWRRPTRVWVVRIHPPLKGFEMRWVSAAPGDWPESVPEQIWHEAVAELGAASIVCLRQAMGGLARMRRKADRILDRRFGEVSA